MRSVLKVTPWKSNFERWPQRADDAHDFIDQQSLKLPSAQREALKKDPKKDFLMEANRTSDPFLAHFDTFPFALALRPMQGHAVAWGDLMAGRWECCRRVSQ